MTPGICSTINISLCVHLLRMRKIIAELAISVKGIADDVTGALDCLVFDEDAEFANEFLSRFEVIFFGRTAYEKYGVLLSPGEWKESEILQGDTIMHIRKFVFSRTAKHVAGNGMVISTHLADNVRRIKEEEGKDIWLCAGEAIVNTFTSLGLVDEYILVVRPGIPGNGEDLLASIKNRVPLRFIGSETLRSGVVILSYAPSSSAIRGPARLP